jgi:hypothetical protein
MLNQRVGEFLPSLDRKAEMKEEQAFAPPVFVSNVEEVAGDLLRRHIGAFEVRKFQPSSPSSSEPSSAPNLMSQLILCSISRTTRVLR